MYQHKLEYKNIIVCNLTSYKIASLSKGALQIAKRKLSKLHFKLWFAVFC